MSYWRFNTRLRHSRSRSGLAHRRRKTRLSEGDGTAESGNQRETCIWNSSDLSFAARSACDAGEIDGSGEDGFAD